MENNEPIESLQEFSTEFEKLVGRCLGISLDVITTEVEDVMWRLIRERNE